MLAIAFGLDGEALGRAATIRASSEVTTPKPAARAASVTLRESPVTIVSRRAGCLFSVSLTATSSSEVGSLMMYSQSPLVSWRRAAWTRPSVRLS
ncbi:MAG: hypothetical protein L0J58_08265 [Micrococcaceae bacterium]|nr:hypothetical protein [Micrococcaceae bacterium]